MRRLTEHPVSPSGLVDTKSTRGLSPERFRESFWQRVVRGTADECWGWTGSKTPFGRGQVHLRWEGKKSIRKNAPVVAWELTYGEIANGLCVCHRCDNPNCCNPSHLFLGTQRDNIHDCIRKGRRNAFGRQVLHEPQVRQIRSLAAMGQRHAAIARQFGIARNTVSGIVNGATWRHLLDEAIAQDHPGQSQPDLASTDVVHQVFEPVAFRELPVVGEVR